MTSRRIISVWAAWVAIGLTLTPVNGGAQQGPPAFRAATDAVTVDVAVQRRGRPVTDLVATDFIILDNGIKQTVTDVTYGKLPIDLTIALDVSYSVSGPVLAELRRAVRQLSRDLVRGDRLRVLTFNMRVRRAVDFTEDLAAADRLGDVAVGGSTAAFDTLAVALVSAAPPDRRRLVMLFTDGNDSSSVTDVPTLLDVVRRTTPTIGVVLPLAPIGPAPLNGLVGMNFISREFYGLQQLFEPIVRESGGSVMVAASSGDLTSTFRRMLDDFRSSYVLHFTPRGVDRAGFHALTVQITRAGQFDVRARRGYEW